MGERETVRRWSDDGRTGGWWDLGRGSWELTRWQSGRPGPELLRPGRDRPTIVLRFWRWDILGTSRRSPGRDDRLLGVGPLMSLRTRLRYVGRRVFRPWRDCSLPPSLAPAMNRWAIFNRPCRDAEGPFLPGQRGSTVGADPDSEAPPRTRFTDSTGRRLAPANFAEEPYDDALRFGDTFPPLLPLLSSVQISTPQPFPGLSEVEQKEGKVAKKKVKKQGMIPGIYSIGDIPAA